MSESKESKVIELFYNEPTKHWHFKDMQKQIQIADNKLSCWLKKFKDQNLIKRIKTRGKMPYYVSNYDAPNYRNKKRLFALEKCYKSGLLNHLTSIDAQTVILFGSFSRWDWHGTSDIDLFIYGNDDDFDIAKYQKILKREIQLFNARDNNDLKKMGNKLIKNIIKGDIIKGDINFLEVKAHA